MKSIFYNSKRKDRNSLVISLIISLLLIFFFINTGNATIAIVYPQTSTRWTGSVTQSGTIATSSVMYTKGGTTGTRDRAWMKFDLASIPSGSTINNVTLKYFITNMYLPVLQFRKVTVDPVTAAGTTLWSQIGSGFNYLQVSNNSLGWNTRVFSGAGGTQIKTDIQNAISTGWFALGMYETSNSGYFEAYADGWNQSNKPYLIIDYTSNLQDDIALDSIASPVNFDCEDIYPVILKVTNAGINSINSVIINWSINSVAQTPINYTFTPPLLSNTTRYITLTTMQFNFGNYIIQATLANPNNNSDPFTMNNSKTALLVITPKPSIYMQPTNQSIGVGGDAMFSTVGSGGSITYQWQLSADGGVTFNNLLNVPPHSNVTSPNMNITAATQSMNGYLYRCIVTGTCPPPAITDTVMLSVGPPVSVKAGHGYACVNQTTNVPVIVKDAIGALGMKFTLNYVPASVTYNLSVYTNPLLSSNGSFSITSTSGHITIQWTGATPVTLTNDTICKLNFTYFANSTLIFDTTTVGNCKVSGPGGALFPSNYYNGIITTAEPGIVTQPNSVLAVAGQPAYFTVVASGVPTYQWQVSIDNGTTWNNLLSSNPAYSGVNSATLAVLLPTLQMNGYRYRCILNSCGTTLYTNGAVMSVIKLVKTWLDTIYDCTCYTPPRDILVSIHVANFDSINSISLSFFFKNSAIQYNGIQWMNPNLFFPFSNIVFNSPNNNYDNFRFASIKQQGYMAIADSVPMMILKFKVLCDTTKMFWEVGACTYSTGPDTAIYTFDSQFTNGYVLDAGPAVITQPSNTTIYAGNNATFTCSGVTYGSPLGYQWQYSTNGSPPWTDCPNNPPYAGSQSPTLTVYTSSTAMNGYQFRCKLTGKCDDAYTNAATLTVNAPPIYLTIPTIVGCQGDSIIVPINVANFSQVCKVKLTLQFNNALYNYDSYKELNTSLPPATTFSVTQSGNTITIIWEAATQGTISGTNAFIKLKFYSTQLFANSPLTWTTGPTTLYFKNCSNVVVASQASNSTVSVNPIPVIHNVTTPYPGAGHFCSGDLGVQISVDITQVGVNYALYRNGSIVPGYGGIEGTGFGMTFNTFNTPGYYTVTAFYPATGCSVPMDGFVNVVADTIPTLYTVTPSGTSSYCTGGTGVQLGLSGSQTGREYFLYRDGFVIDTLPGTGSALNFFNQTIAGTYTIAARNVPYETCMRTMNGSAIITINPYPDAAGTITGPGTVCQGQSYNYSVPAIPNATSYLWTLSAAGANITAGANTNAITVSYSNAATSGTISVRGNNLCGDGATTTRNITVRPIPGAAGTIAGPDSVCVGATGITYSVPAIANATSYEWVFPPTGFTITANNGTTCTVNVGLNAVPGSITVRGQDSCGYGTISSKAVYIKQKPGDATNITGNLTPCQGAQNVQYSTPPITNAQSYTWTWTGINVTGSSTTNVLNLNFAANTGTGTLTVKGHNTCGDGGAFTINITPVNLPSAAGTITGPADVCKGLSYNYTIPTITGATTYNWATTTGFTGSSTTPTIVYNVGGTSISGNITVSGQNVCGLGASTTKSVTVHTPPTPTQTDFPTICKDGPPYLLTGGLPANGTYSGPGVSGGNFNPANVSGAGTYTITYTYTDAFGCTGSVQKQITVVDFPKISGTITYDNIWSTPLGHIKVILKNASNVPLDSTYSSSVSPYSNYAFKCLTASTSYNLACTTGKAFPTSFVNAQDALKILRYAVGLDTLSLLRRKAADVNASNSVNAVDPLLVVRRWAGAITSFQAGDWLFNPWLFNSVNVGSTSVTQNIKAICFGDVDGSYHPIPDSMTTKLMPSVFMEKSGITTLLSKDIIEIPIKIKSPLSIGSVSLAVNLSSNAVEVINVKSPLKDFIWNMIDNQLRFAWYSLEAADFNTGETLLTITVRMKNKSYIADHLDLDADVISVITDERANAYERAELSVPEIKIQESSDIPVDEIIGFKLGANQPNPFSDVTEITYSIPETGDVHLSVLNVLGEEVKVIVNSQQSAGNYKVQFEGNGLTSGMYIYKLVLKGVSQQYSQSRPMILMD